VSDGFIKIGNIIYSYYIRGEGIMQIEYRGRSFVVKDEVDYYLGEIRDDVEKGQFLNALSLWFEVGQILIKAFNDVLKGKSMNNDL